MNKESIQKAYSVFKIMVIIEAICIILLIITFKVSDLYNNSYMMNFLYSGFFDMPVLISLYICLIMDTFMLNIFFAIASGGFLTKCVYEKNKMWKKWLILAILFLVFMNFARRFSAIVSV